MRILIVLSLLVFGHLMAYTQELAAIPFNSSADKEGVEQQFLIDDPYLRSLSVTTLKQLYNYEFGKASNQINFIKDKYAWHPMGYFMLALIEWWKLIPNMEDPSYDESFLNKIDETIFVGEKLYLNPSYSAEASFFLSAAFGMKSQLMLERDNYGKSISAGRSSLRHLNELREFENLNVELKFGIGLYNYYAEWVPETYPLLKPVFLFLPDGSKKLGTQQLKEVYATATFTNIEAAVYLVEIMLREGKQGREQALKLLNEIQQDFPDNRYFNTKRNEILRGEEKD